MRRCCSMATFYGPQGNNVQSPSTNNARIPGTHPGHINTVHQLVQINHPSAALGTMTLRSGARRRRFRISSLGYRRFRYLFVPDGSSNGDVRLDLLHLGIGRRHLRHTVQGCL